MTPEKDIRKVITQMTGVTEQQIVQRMHEFNAAIEARSPVNRPVAITESQPENVQSRIETSQQVLQLRPFANGTGNQQTTGGASSSGSTALPIIQMIMNSNGTAVYVDVNAQITSTV